MAAFARERLAKIDRISVLQWTAVGLVGIILGGFSVAVTSLPSQWAPLLVLAALFPFLAMIIGNVRKLLLAIIILDISFQLDIHLAFQPEAGKLGALGGLSISATTLSLVILYALWASELLARKESLPWRLFHSSVPLALYIAFAVFSLLVAIDVTLAMFEIFLLLQTFLLFVYIVGTVRTRQDALFIVTMLLIGLILQSLVMIGLGFVGKDFSIAGISSRIDATTGTAGQFYRVAGTIGHPNNAASYLSLLLASALSLLLTRLGKGYKWLAALAFLLGGMALILTFSRGGWVAFALSITILCLLAWNRGWLPLTVPVVIIVAVILLSLPFQDAIITRLFDVQRALSRIPLQKISFRMILDNPVLGIGANNSPIAMKNYITPEFAGAWIYAVHNKYLLIWAEIGIGGLVAFLWFLLATIRRGWQCWKLKDRLLSPLALGLTAAIVGQMVHMFADVFHTRSQVQLLWLIAGLIAAMRNIVGKEG